MFRFFIGKYSMPGGIGTSGIADDPSGLLLWVLKWYLSWRIIHNPVKPDPFGVN